MSLKHGAAWLGDGGESVAEGSINSSVERHAMHEQLDTVRTAVNKFEADNAPQPSRGPPAFANEIAEIRSRLDFFENQVSGVSSKVDNIDHRMKDRDKGFKDLQHLSAEAVHETARLADAVLGGRATPMSHHSLSAAPPRRSATYQQTPNMVSVVPPLAAPRAALPVLEYVPGPGHLTATIQTHASSIHKLMAGLDFLESHIIRQDQILEGVQKQLTMTGSMAPNETSMRLHDLNEVVNKIKAHMHRVEKKALTNDQGITGMSNRLSQLASRLQALENSKATVDAEAEVAAQLRGPVVTAEQISQLVTSQEDLRILVRSLGREVQQLREEATQQARRESVAGAAEDAQAAEMRKQLEYLMGQVPVLVVENAELRKFATRAADRLSELVSTDSELRAALPQPDAMAAAAARAVAEGAASKAEFAALSNQVALLTQAQQASAVLLATRSAAVQAPEDAIDVCQLQADVVALRERIDQDAVAVRKLAAQEPAVAAIAAAEVGQSILAQVEQQQDSLKDTVLAMVAGVEQQQAAVADKMVALSREVEAQQEQLQANLAVVQDLQQQVGQQLAQSRAIDPVLERDALKAELFEVQRELFSGVLDKVKERVEENLAEMNAQIEAVHGSSAQSQMQMSAMLQRLEDVAAGTDAANRKAAEAYEQAAVSASQAAAASEQAAVASQQAATAMEQAATASEQASAASERALAASVQAAAASEQATMASEQATAAKEQASVASGQAAEASEQAISAGVQVTSLSNQVAAASEQAAATMAAMEQLRSDLLVMSGQHSILLAKVGTVETAIEEVLGSDEVAELRAQLDSGLARLSGDIGQLGGGLTDCGDRVTSMAVSQKAADATIAKLLVELQEVQDQVQELGANLAACPTTKQLDILGDALAAKAAEHASSLGMLAGQVEALRARLDEELALKAQQASESITAINASLQRDYINREQLGLIFAARADMKRALDEISTVFDTGRLTREVADSATGPSRALSINADVLEAELAAAASLAAAAKDATTRLETACEQLGNKQTEMAQQLQLALFRSENSVKYEHLSAMHKAMNALEVQVKRLAGAPSAAPGLSSAALTDLQIQLAALQEQVAALSDAAAARGTTPAAAVSEAAAKSSSGACAGTADSSHPVLLRLVIGDEGAHPVHLRLEIQSAQTVAVAPSNVGEEPVDAVTMVDSASAKAVAAAAVAEAAASIVTELEQLRNEVREVSARCMEMDAAASAGSGAAAAAGAALATELEELRIAVRELSARCGELQDDFESSTEDRQRMELQLEELQGRVDALVAEPGDALCHLTSMVEEVRDQMAELVAKAVPASMADMDATEPISRAFSASHPVHVQLVVEDCTDAGPHVRLELEASPAEEGAAAEQGAAPAGDSAAATADAASAAASAAVADVAADVEELRHAVRVVTGRCVELQDELDRSAAARQHVVTLLEDIHEQMQVLQEQVAAAAAAQPAADLATYAAATSADRAAAVIDSQWQELRTAVQQLEQQLSLVSSRVDAVATAQQHHVTTHTSDEAVCELVASQVAAAKEQLQAASAADYGVRFDGVQQQLQTITAEVESLAAGVQRASTAFTMLDEHSSDIMQLRDQMVTLSEQVQAAVVASAAPAMVTLEPSAGPEPGSPPLAMRTSASGIALPGSSSKMLGSPAPRPSPSTKQLAALSNVASQGQGQFLARLVEVVKSQSQRLHSQYGDEAEMNQALNQVDDKLNEVESHLPEARDMSSPAYAEAMVTVLEQVAALRFIGSQTHPAIHQMLLSHDSQLQQIAQQLKSLAAEPASQPATAVAAETESTRERLAELDVQVKQVLAHNASLDKAISDIMATAQRLSAAAADGSSDAVELPLAAVVAKIELLEESVKAQVTEMQQLREARLTGGDSVPSEGLVDKMMFATLTQRVEQLYESAKSMKNRIVAVQEYVDSTQGMIKDMHVGLGGLLRRADVLEAAIGSGGTLGSGADTSGSAKALQHLHQLESKLHALEVTTTDMAHTLAASKTVPMRLTETEAKATDLAGKVAAIGTTLPVFASQLKGLERKLYARLDIALGALDALSSGLAQAKQVQAESTANPFKAISAAVNNPVVVALQQKVDVVLMSAVTAVDLILDDLKREQRDRGMSLSREPSVSGGSNSGLR